MEVKILLYGLLATSGLYFLVILIITIGWYKIKGFVLPSRNINTTVSVVIAYRNESKQLPVLLNDLLKQNFPEQKLEIIMVNDHSTDESKKIVEEFLKKTNHLKLIDATAKGKKNALKEGVKIASGELIISTDADCRLPENWLLNITAFYEKEHPLVIFGPVVYERENNLKQKFFSLDFLSLVASGAGSAGIGLPLMGNGANIAFEKDLFLQSEKQIQKAIYTSGDDVFLMHYVYKKYGSEKIMFLKNKACIVKTKSPSNFKEFIEQRARWGSKAKGYELIWPLFVAFTVFFFNTLLVFSTLVGVFVPWLFIIFFLFVVFKYLTDLPLLIEFGNFAGKRSLISYLLPFEFIYPFYLVFAAVKGIFFPYKWKDRKNLK